MAYPKRLIEVDLPIRAISEQARREKAIRHGHISTLHLWWARRPLASCRAVTCATLWPDPVDVNCPQAFREAASLALSYFAAQVRIDPAVAAICGKHAQERWFRLTPAVLDPRNIAARFDMRYALLDFIADFSDWDASTLPAFLEPTRLLTHVAHLALSDPTWILPIKWDMRDSNESLREAINKVNDAIRDLPRPLVVDPFAGGGSIPFETLRVGADSFASDLNPIPVLLNKVLLEYLPKFGIGSFESCDAEGKSVTFNGLAEAVRYWGNWVKCEAEKGLSGFYPKDPDGSTPIAYLWARTIKCEGPGCGAEVPLLRSLILANKPGRNIALHPTVDQGAKKIRFIVVEKRKTKWVATSDPTFSLDALTTSGFIQRGSVTCPVCGYTTPINHVRVQLKKRKGGTNDAQLLCVVTLKPNTPGRSYRLPTSLDFQTLEKVKHELSKKQAIPADISLVPDEEISTNEIRRISVLIYGMTKWGDLFTERQQLALSFFSDVLSSLPNKFPEFKNNDFIIAVQVCLALALSKQADLSNSLCRWKSDAECPVNLFARQAIPMLWDFAESVPLTDSSGSWFSMYERTAYSLEKVTTQQASQGHTMKCSATNLLLPDDSVNAYITDPPYYDAVPYAHLSDFFYVWLRRTLLDSVPDLFSSELVAKEEEIVVDRPHELSTSKKDIAFYERELTRAFSEGRRVLMPSGVGTIVFASKTTSSWEAILKAIIDANWTITGSWPIDTEMDTRVAAQGQARLASSIHLVCRPRETSDGTTSLSVGDWREVLSELPGRIQDWLPRLSHEGVVGADAIFACLGPALEIFSRYSHVEKASGETVTLNEYLEHVWAAVSREALGMIFEGADATGFEEDARLTAMWLWTLKTENDTKGNTYSEQGQLSIEPEEDDDESIGQIERVSGFEMEYDAARKIAQGLGAHLERMNGLVQIKGDKARLLGVSDRAQFLFGRDDPLLSMGRKKKIDVQMSLFSVMDDAEAQAGDWGGKNSPKVGETILDQLHQVMLLFASGRNEAIKRFLIDEGVGKDNRFWRLSQALSALYPSGTDEKRWVDGVLAKKKGLGF